MEEPGALEIATNPVIGRSTGMLHRFIKNGNLRAGMPSWSRLPDQQLWQLVTYVQSLRD